MTDKQKEFNEAMEKYEKLAGYVWTGHVVSFIVVASQVALGVMAFRNSIVPVNQIITFVSAFILADLVNGFVHMYMDNNEDYTSPVGPLVAAFHLHHRTPLYKVKPLYAVYFAESGSKVWLAVLMLIVVAGALQGIVTGALLYGFFYFSVLSSIAEVSHYLCHAPAPKAARVLSSMGILMSARYHARHHTGDNFNYTFLNCMTDPLVNMTAKVLYPKGYKTTTDTHYAMYTGAGTENR